MAIQPWSKIKRKCIRNKRKKQWKIGKMSQLKDKHTWNHILCIDSYICIYIYRHNIHWYIYIYIYLYLYHHCILFRFIYPWTKNKKKKCRPSWKSTSSGPTNRVVFFLGAALTSNPSVLHHPNAIRRFEIPQTCLGHAKGHPGKTPFGWASNIRYRVYHCIYPLLSPFFLGGGLVFD